jgi:integrase
MRTARSVEFEQHLSEAALARLNPYPELWLRNRLRMSEMGIDPVPVDSLRRASPHWLRHTHATHALARGTSLTVCRASSAFN